jgi:hypothetical protein
MQQSNHKKHTIRDEIHRIYELAGLGKYAQAKDRFDNFEKQNPNDTNMQFSKLGLLVDIGHGLKDQTVVQRGVSAGEQNLNDRQYVKYRNDILYNLANGYSVLYELSERSIGREKIPQSENLQKAKKCFREILGIYDAIRPDLKKQVFVNYGNCLDMLGRGVEALYAYADALKIDKNFSMAIGNKAQALRFFADISGQYKSAIYIEAYQEIQAIINNQDLTEIGGVDSKQRFEAELKRIEERFKDKKALCGEICHSRYDTETLSDFEKFYLDFCAKERIFLNFHVHDEYCEAAIADPIFISLITKVEDNETFYNLAKYINQIKEDYAVARMLLVQSQYKQKDFDNISRRTDFVNTLDYSQFNLYTGLLKSAFSEAYSILDKIAVFINDYYKLGLPEDKIYFTSVWQKNGKIRDEILNSRNISLYALYDIYQDFKSNHYGKIQKIRNAITHRLLVIYDSMLTNWDKKDDKHNIGYNTMVDKTIELLRLTKSAIIYLINFVNMEENRKRTPGAIIPIVPVDTSQFI